MNAGLAAVLAGLGLIDATSFGTLLIPIWLLLAPGRVRAGRVAAYLGTVAAFYFLVGVALAAGADTALMVLRSAMDSLAEPPLRVAQLAAGAFLIALSYRLEARIRRGEGREGRLRRWRAQAIGESSARDPDSACGPDEPGGARDPDSACDPDEPGGARDPDSACDPDEPGGARGPDGARGPGGLMRLAVVAAGIETATMIPYLTAIGLLTAAELSAPMFGTALAVYCLIMVLPAALLSIARIAWHDRAARILTRVDDRLTRNNAKLVGWTVGGIGIGVTLNAAINLAILT